MRSLLVLMIIAVLPGCSENKKQVNEIITYNKTWLDSIRQHSDTTFTKNYRNRDFVTADYYINRSNRYVCQVMKDSAGTIRQILAEKNGIRTLTEEYYPNGQLKARLPLDSTGNYNGTGIYYFENGQVKSEGPYVRGFFSGTWKNYDEKSHFISSDQYDSNGQLVRTIKN